MLDTSKDIMYIVVAFCVLWLTIFLCWMLYYLAMMFRNANEIIQEIRDKTHGIAQALEFIREKIEFVAGGMSFLSKYIGKHLGLQETVENLEKKWVGSGDTAKKPKKRR